MHFLIRRISVSHNRIFSTKKLIDIEYRSTNPTLFRRRLEFETEIVILQKWLAARPLDNDKPKLLAILRVRAVERDPVIARIVEV